MIINDLKQNNLEQLVRPNIANLTSYECARYNDAKGILLDANENPFGCLNRYPDPMANDLRAALADYIGVKSRQVLACNGSDEGIDLLIRALCEPGQDNVFVKKPSYGMYEVMANVNNVEVAESINDSTKIIFLCSPNNPSGELLDMQEILAYCENNALVVLDEAYIEFASVESLACEIGRIKNLVILRTLSKAWGAAGIRLGYVIADEFVINVLAKVKYPYNVNTLTQNEALKILSNPNDMKKQVETILNERERVEKRLKEFGLKVFPSEANFLLFEVGDASNVKKKLETLGVIIRDRTGDFKNALRVSIGTKDKNDKFLDSLAKCLIKVAFLDRDGALIFEPQDDFQVDSLEKYKILDGVISGLQELKKRGYKLVMITNQNGIGSDSFPEEDFLLVQNQFLDDMKKNGAEFYKVFVCPHFPEANCECRKPKTGMVDDFLANTAINLGESFVMGDRDTDIQFAENIGVRGFKMRTNSEFLIPKL